MAETENKTLQKDKKRRVKALFSYTPVNMDELHLKVNDILEVIEETEEGWWKGVLNGTVGMFPSNFVIEIDNPELCNNKSNNNEITPTKSLPKIKNADILETNFKKELTHSSSTKQDTKSTSEDSTVSPKVPDFVDRKVSLSKKNVDPTAPRLPPKPVREQARVIYPYTALNEDELTMKEGDIITVISKEVEDKGWWRGELNNKTGVFPDNFVQLIKVAEEQKKPERPEKPSSALVSKANLKAASTDKAVPEFSPKVDKKNTKTPPVKPPPPEIHKKDHEKGTPPYPIKKPQIPFPMKKPSRSSLGSKFSGFSPPSTISSSKPPDTPPPVPPAPVTPPVTIASESKSEVTKSAEKNKDKEDKDVKKENKDVKKENKDVKKENKDVKKENKDVKKENKDVKKENKDVKKENKDIKKENKDAGFEGLESSGKKLIHLTANRAKVPNRRPPSHIFLRENEKENGISVDSRRLSEPLLSEMKLMHQLEEVDSHKASVTGTNETKAKVPPSRPLPPSVKGNKPAIQGSLILTKTISSEECIVKAPEPIKKAVLPDVSGICAPDILPTKRTDISTSDFKPVSSEKEVLLPKKTDTTSSDFKPFSSEKEVLQLKKTDISTSDFKPFLSEKEVLQPKKADVSSSDFKPFSFDKEVPELKDSLQSLKTTAVTRNEFNELAKQVKELKESLEKCITTNKKTISELKSELESERKKRQALEIELHQMKESQST